MGGGAIAKGGAGGRRSTGCNIIVVCGTKCRGERNSIIKRKERFVTFMFVRTSGVAVVSLKSLVESASRSRT